MLKKSSVSPPILGGDDEKSNLLVADQKFVTPITRVVSRTSNIYNFSSSSLSKFSILDISVMKNKRNTFGNKIWILESQINSKSRLLIRVIIKHNRTNKKAMEKTNYTFKERSLRLCKVCGIWSDWWENMIWPIEDKNNILPNLCICGLEDANE